MPTTAPPRPSPLACRVLLALAAWPFGARAGDAVLPAGPAVVQGQARIVTRGPDMTVTTGRNAAIDWRSFSIGRDASVRFDQPDASSKVLNRVLGREPSQILGRLTSNGEVWLVNPYGVLFGRDARVDVGGLVASSLNVSLADWAAGRRTLAAAEGLPAAAVANAGTLRSVTGGRILLVGSGEVTNEGVIESPRGEVGLRAAREVELADSTRPDIAVRLAAGDGAVTNRGTLLAPGGRVDLQAAMVNQSGVVRADGIAAGPGGSVLLRASEAVHVAGGSTTSASGATGGRIEVVGGTQLVEGRIEAGSPSGAGGQIGFAAPRIALLDGATVAADGAQGGGAIAIGLARPAAGGQIPAAEAVFVGAGARLSADALQRGDGGRIALWSDSATRVFGSLSARGGPQGGDGGFIETSGGAVQARPALVDTGAPNGRAGSWLLDPFDVTIVQGLAAQQVGPEPDFSALGTQATVGTDTIIAALQRGDVTISTGTAGAEAGTLSMTGATLREPASIAIGARTLTLQAASRIELTGSTIDFSELNLRLFAGTGASGGITLTNSNIDVGSGAVTMTGTEFRSATSHVGAGTIDLQASLVDLGAPRVPIGAGPQPALEAQGSDNALIVRGPAGSVDSFNNRLGGADALRASEGNWLLYARDPAAVVDLGGLVFDFKQYGAAFPTAPLGSGNGLLLALQPVLGVAAPGLPLGKVYDGTTALALTTQQLGSIGLTGFVAGDVPVRTTGLVAGVEFDTRDAGDAVPLTARLADGLPAVFDGSRRPVFGYTFSGRGLVGSIDRKPVNVTAATVADKVYDGTTAGTVTAWSLGGVLGGDRVAVASGSATFGDANAGTNKPALAQAAALGGEESGNYVLGQSTVPSLGTIERAPLTVRAAPVTVADGAGWPALRGDVTGFVGSETLDTATSGTLRFDSPAGPGAAPGVYPVTGGGIVAGNYVLVQDPANARALRVLPGDADDALPRSPVTAGWPPSGGFTGTGGMTVVPPPGTAGFPPLDFPGLPGWRVDADIAAREVVMQRAFRESSDTLAREPGLARLPACGDVASALRGTCVITEEIRTLLKNLWQDYLARSGPPPGLTADQAFDAIFWIDPGSATRVLGPRGWYVPGDGSLRTRLPSDPDMLARLTRGPGTPPVAGAPAVTVASPGDRPATGAPAITVPPPADLSAAGAAPPPSLADAGTDAQPGSGASGSSPPGPVSGSGSSSAKAQCVTEVQRRSGECRRRQELEALHEALQQCAQESPDRQPACLFSREVKLRLQQRERALGALSEELRARDASRKVVSNIRRKWALVIGVGRYNLVEIAGDHVQMPNAANDARAVAHELSSRFGYITAAPENPSRADVVQRLNMLTAVAQPEDSLLVYFSGYGFSIPQAADAVWALDDADPRDGRTVLSHADLAEMLRLVDARQVALVSDSSLAGSLREAPLDYNPMATPDLIGLLDRRALVALTSGGNLPMGSIDGQGLSYFTDQFLSVLRRVKTWHVGGRIFREVQAPMIKAGRQFIPQYGAASQARHGVRADYLFERRDLQPEGPVRKPAP